MTDNHVISDPSIASGLPVLRSSSMPVYEILARLAETIPAEGFDRALRLEFADVKAALEYAAGLARQQALPGPAALPGPGTDGELDPKKIMLVDDISENLILIQYMFRGTDYHLITATSAREALQKARTELPILVISDIQMPGMSGLELLTALKSDRRTQNIAVILVTAHQRGSQQISRGLTMGADDYIYRPFMNDEFMSRVDAVLRVRRAEAEAKRHAQVVARRNKGLELVNELALAVNSSLNLQEIFASSMQKLSQLLAAAGISLVLMDEDRHELVVSVLSRTGARFSQTFAWRLAAAEYEQSLQEQVPALVKGVLQENQATLGLEVLAEAIYLQTIPVRSKEQLIGAIIVINRPGDTLDEADDVLLNSAAGIIAVAVENAHLLAGAQQQVDDLIALNEIGRALTSTLDLDQILKQTTLLVQRSLEADAASLWLLDEKTQELVVTASSGPGSDVIAGFRLPVYQGIAGYVARTGEFYISGDVSRDEHHSLDLAELSHYNHRSLMCVPVQAKGKTIGVMQALHREPDWFDTNDLRLFYPVASSMSIAVENARLFAEVQDFNRRLEQKVVERTRELAEEKEKTEAILASMADGLLVLDAENRILMANAVVEHMLDFRLADLAGQPIGPAQLVHPLWRSINEMISTTRPTINTPVDVPTGQPGGALSIQAHSAKVRNETGQVIGTVIVLRDITALKEVERMKARFMAGVTHELKTPLSVIQLHTKNLLTYSQRLPEQKRIELLNSIQNQVKLLGQLIEDILELSRLDAGGGDAERQVLDLVRLVDAVVADLRPLAEAKRIRLLWSRAAATITTLANPRQMERVVRNLIDNAIRYTPANGSIEVRTRMEWLNGSVLVKLEVTDTGMGILPEHKERIFDRFYRVDPSHTIPGTGLGLAIVKEIVNAHGGNVVVESTPGTGSNFIVTLPGLTAGPGS